MAALLKILFFAASACALTKVQVGSSPVMSSAGIYIADEMGYFRDEGLDVNLIDIPSSGGAMTALLAAGKLDVAAGNLSAGLFSSILEGRGVKIVADKGHLQADRDYIALLVRTDLIKSGRFKTLHDLKGLKVGLTSLDGVSQQVVADRFLSRSNLHMSDVDFIKLSYAEMNAALKTRGLDAAIQLEPFIAQAEAEGFAKQIQGANDVHPGQQSAAVLYSESFRRQRENAIKFMRAYLRGVRLYNSSLGNSNDLGKIKKLLTQKFKINSGYYDKMIPVGLNDDGELNVQTLQEDLDWYYDKKFLKSPLKADLVLDLSFVRAAAKDLQSGLRRNP